MSNNALTRDECFDLLAECGDDVAQLRALEARWNVSGHWNENVTVEQWQAVLEELIEYSVQDADNCRSNGPKGDTLTDSE